MARHSTPELAVKDQASSLHKAGRFWRFDCCQGAAVKVWWSRCGASQVVRAVSKWGAVEKGTVDAVEVGRCTRIDSAKDAVKLETVKFGRLNAYPGRGRYTRMGDWLAGLQVGAC